MPSIGVTHNPQHARSMYHTQLAKIIFDEILDLTELRGLFYFMKKKVT